MSHQQTEAEQKISSIMMKLNKDTTIEPESFHHIKVQTFVCEDVRNAMAISVSSKILHELKLNYTEVINPKKQQFSDYFVLFIKEYLPKDGKKGIPESVIKSWRNSACYPFLLTRLRTDILSCDSEVTNVLVERRCTFTKAEKENVGHVLSQLTGRTCTIEVNYHT